MRKAPRSFTRRTLIGTLVVVLVLALSAFLFWHMELQPPQVTFFDESRAVDMGAFRENPAGLGLDAEGTLLWLEIFGLFLVIAALFSWFAMGKPSLQKIAKDLRKGWTRYAKAANRVLYEKNGLALAIAAGLAVALIAYIWVARSTKDIFLTPWQEPTVVQLLPYIGLALTALFGFKAILARRGKALADLFATRRARIISFSVMLVIAVVSASSWELWKRTTQSYFCGDNPLSLWPVNLHFCMSDVMGTPDPAEPKTYPGCLPGETPDYEHGSGCWR